MSPAIGLPSGSTSRPEALAVGLTTIRASVAWASMRATAPRSWSGVSTWITIGSSDRVSVNVPRVSVFVASNQGCAWGEVYVPSTIAPAIGVPPVSTTVAANGPVSGRGMVKSRTISTGGFSTGIVNLTGSTRAGP